MLTGPFLPKTWIGASEDFENSSWVIVGLPYDGTCSFRPGTRFGPEVARLASWGIETYSPYQDRNLEDINFYDAGDLDLPMGNRDRALGVIENAARETLSFGKHWFGFGGEHLVTYPAVKAYLEKYPDLAVIHFDAHADLREDYLGEKLSHATVIRRISDHIGFDSIYQVGIRSGPKDEFDLIRNNKTLLTDKSELQVVKEKFKNRPVFLTIDLDVFDPSIFSGTGTPEPGGLTYNEFMGWIKALEGLNFVGVDIVELSPHYDISGVSNVLAAKVVREILLLINR